MAAATTGTLIAFGDGMLRGTDDGKSWKLVQTKIDAYLRGDNVACINPRYANVVS